MSIYGFFMGSAREEVRNPESEACVQKNPARPREILTKSREILYNKELIISAETDRRLVDGSGNPPI